MQLCPLSHKICSLLWLCVPQDPTDEDAPVEAVYCLAKLGVASIELQIGSTQQACEQLLLLIEQLEGSAPVYSCVATLMLARVKLDLSEYSISVCY